MRIRIPFGYFPNENDEIFVFFLFKSKIGIYSFSEEIPMFWVKKGRIRNTADVFGL